MRRITDELTWGVYQSDKTYETIRVVSRGEIEERRKVTRFENFVATHGEWESLCDYVGRLASIIYGEPMVIFKEKLNLKPPGGSGFAPHLDTPSLRVALGNKGPQEFVTVMVAIDAMTEANGCLQFVKGKWSEENAVPTVQPEKGSNPDGNGREGAIAVKDAQNLPFVPHPCPGGTIVLFKGWVPHKSGANRSPFPRRAVFLTYNPAKEGRFRDEYYKHMERLRSEFRIQAGLEKQRDAQAEMDALATIPRI
jgi:ectoine hydroxylase-related dioxygenase (phytanoyl-CoA dioxygenase family)